MKNNNIVLTGFMGVGKGSLARELSKRIGLITIDTDDIIESMENKKIKKIFEESGEDYFRECEKRVFRWLQKSVKNSIISVGGGFYNAGNLKKIGHVIYLESSFDAILERINSFENSKSKLKKRPLLQDMQKAKKLLTKRHPEYLTSAHSVVNTEKKTTSQIAQEIISLLNISK